ncbi:hypothetical protein WICPIJ_005001 [Wickerhamomyces pijperi]|uniref:Uncharacterized protein n=1 Tax=Wickerhamomyces pijperi TaxID=599730 RepID=A0A9P8Q723_WICPI|nr:hypothetical protein WICPIJ_005001 [Wickerhamomyces pijperi]
MLPSLNLLKEDLEPQKALNCKLSSSVSAGPLITSFSDSAALISKPILALIVLLVFGFRDVMSKVEALLKQISKPNNLSPRPTELVVLIVGQWNLKVDNVIKLQVVLVGVLQEQDIKSILEDIVQKDQGLLGVVNQQFVGVVTHLVQNVDLRGLVEQSWRIEPTFDVSCGFSATGVELDKPFLSQIF